MIAIPKSRLMPHRSNGPSKGEKNGLTLIEMMVAICIISLMTAMVGVSFKPMWDKRQLELAIQDMNDFVQLLRMRAILEKRTFQMKFSDNCLFYRKKREGAWENWQNRALANGVSYSMSGTTSFYNKGFASPKTITLSYNDYRQKIIININGRTRTSEIY